MTRILAASSTLFRDRELFVHDGTKLRRLRLPWRAQALFAMFIGVLVAFSTYSIVRFLAPAQTHILSSQIPVEMVRLAAATEQRVNEIEQRQQLRRGRRRSAGAGRRQRRHLQAVVQQLEEAR